MPSDHFASRTRTASGGARATALGFAALVALVAFVATMPGGRTGSPPSSASARTSSSIAASPASSATSLPLPSPSLATRTGLEWGVIPDLSGLAGLGVPVGVAAGEQGIVATGTSGVAWSADGATWTPVPRGPLGLPIVATGGGYFALGDGLGWSSGDGRTWLNVDAPEARGFVIKGIVARGAELLAVGWLRDGGEGNGWGAVFTSADGWTWRREGPSTAPPFDLIAVSGDTVIAAAPGQEGSRQVSVRRADGTWQDAERFPAAASVSGLAARPEGGFVAVGTVEVAGARHVGLWISSDGLTWDARICPEVFEGTPAGIVAFSDGFLLLAEPVAGGLWHSADGLEWTLVSRAPSFDRSTPMAIVATPARLVALGGPLFADGVTLAWTSPPIVPEPERPAERVSGRWTAAGPLPVAADGDRLVALADGSLLLLGGAVPDGTAGVRHLTDVWRRDPGGTWSPRAPMPVPRWIVASVRAADGRVWVMGPEPDQPPSTAMRRVDIYDPARDRWSAGPALPAEVDVRDAVALPDGSVVAVAGGLEIWRVRPGERSWTRVARLPSAGWSTSAAPLPDGSILVVVSTTVDPPAQPGSDGTLQRIVLQAFRIDLATGRTEARTAPAASGSSGGTLVPLGDGRVALVGQYRAIAGSGGGLLLRRVDVYDPATDVWGQLTMLPEPRLGAALAVDATGRLWVAGGADEFPDIGPLVVTDSLWSWAADVVSPPHAR